MIPEGGQFSISRHLDQYAGKLEQLISVLRNEHESLNSKDIAGLEQCTQRKHEILSELEQLEAIRTEADSQQHHGGNSESIPGNHLDEIKDRIKNLLEECRHLNETNGAIVDISKQFNQRLLEVILGKPSAADTYNATGKNDSRLPTQTVAKI